MMRITDNTELDIVYLWVDGSATGFQEKMSSRLRSSNSVKAANQVGTHRFRNNWELLYSLRSVEQFAPWVRKIHLVTDGQCPTWLNTGHEKIFLVTHEQIFECRKDLPVFNSNAIEMNLQRIPGLSRKFVYLNDDLFLGRPSEIDDFLTDAGGQVFFLENLPLHRDPWRGAVHDRAYAFTRTVLQGTWADLDLCFLPAHCPQLYDRNHLCHLEERFREVFRRTSGHPFRMPDDFVLRLLYGAFLMSDSERGNKHHHRLLASGGSDYSFITLQRKPLLMLRAFIHLIRRRPKFICINDDLGDSIADRCILKLETYFLSKLYPEKSCFER